MKCLICKDTGFINATTLDEFCCRRWAKYNELPCPMGCKHESTTEIRTNQRS